MKILVLNGSPRPSGNTAFLVDAFKKGAEEKGHQVTVVPVRRKSPAVLPVNTVIRRGTGAASRKMT